MSAEKEHTTPDETNTKRNGRGRAARLSRPFLVATALIVAGAAFLFWPRGTERPRGIGDQFSVVTEAGQFQGNGLTKQPRSGNVAIEEEVQQLVPEKKLATKQKAETRPEPKRKVETKPEPLAAPPEPVAQSGDRQTADGGQSDTSGSSDAGDKAEPDGQNDAGDKAAPDEQSDAGDKAEPDEQSDAAPVARNETPPAVTPQHDGDWALQVGAFSNEANAQKLQIDLQRNGYNSFLQSGRSPEGEPVYRVWVGYFASRRQAESYAQQSGPVLARSLPIQQ